MIKKIESLYFAVIAWDELIINGRVICSAGEYTFYRNNFNDLVEGVQEYLSKWEGRGAYLELAAEEYDEPNYHMSKFRNYTEDVKLKLKRSK